MPFDAPTSSLRLAVSLLRAFDVSVARHERTFGSPKGESKVSRMVPVRGFEPRSRG